MEKKVSFTITSCNRLDLLEKTLASFFSLNSYFIDEFIMSDDSGCDDAARLLEDKYGDRFEIIHNRERIGLSKSLDNLFRRARNEYIFHCEDDWFFDANPDFISESIAVLEHDQIVRQVYVRHQSDSPHPLCEEIIRTDCGVRYRMVSDSFWSTSTSNWNGYSWNPGLRRKSDYHRMFPSGLSDFGDEYLCADHSRLFGYRAACLENTCCRHMGYGMRTPGFIA